ncbi:M1 family metallopeptidase [Mesonia maritima]|uniref:Aminopeptidase N n=1 Tax=Mesonia maritima TaxID=1793873 RepID=A0ABU1K434_9FLAO|nr:M1 family metallopeptidase [Mesonia maritima]MDR6300380.1 aminopeptidase N [Mesonia maritima]
MKYFLGIVFLLFIQVIFSQQTEKVDFTKIEGNIEILPEQELVNGNLTVEFTVKKNTDSIFLDAKKMSISLAKNSPLKVKLHAGEDKIWIIKNFKADKKYSIKFNYSVTPKQTMYFVGWQNEGSNQVFTQGQGKYTSYWLPSIDDLNDKIEFDLSYKIPKNYTLIANGKLVEKNTEAETTTWKFDMKNPMSSYLVAVVFGNFQAKEISSASGIPMKLYFEPKDSLKVEPTYRYSQQIFDFFEKEIGVPFPWQNYKQIPVRDFLYAGMENTTATIFSDMCMTDSIGFIDRNYVNVNAHELAHQWFGDFVTEKSSKHHWLQEGFATFYALLAEKEIFGEDYYYHKLYETAEQLREMSDNGKGESLLNEKASSLTFYQKGAWALHVLREKVGAEAFKKGVQTYLLKNAYGNVETSDFIEEMEKASGKDLTEFVNDWLKQSAFKATQALESLKKSPFMLKYFQVSALRKSELSDKRTALGTALNFPVNEYIGQEVVYQLAEENPRRVIELYKKAFATNTILVRQAIASTLTDIPRELQSEYERLLKDDSYLTKEKALFNLWQNFPEKRHQYLNELAGVEGFSNKNIELLWLTLNLVTQDYQPQKKQQVYKRLSGYTSPKFAYEIRENAFGYLFQIDSFSEENYKDLLQGCEHQVWRFRNFCRELLKELLSNSYHRERILQLKNEFSETQQEYLQKQI